VPLLYQLVMKNCPNYCFNKALKNAPSGIQTFSDHH